MDRPDKYLTLFCYLFTTPLKCYIVKTMLAHRLALSFLLAAPLVTGHTQVIGATGISTGVSFARNENYLGSSRVNLLMYHPSIYSGERLRFTPAHITAPASKATVEVSTLKVPPLPFPKSSSLLIQTLGFHTLTQAFLPLSSRWGQCIISVLLMVVLSPSPDDHKLSLRGFLRCPPFSYH
jgi:hypothetical protein